MAKGKCQVADVSPGGLLCLDCVACVFEVDCDGRHSPNIPGKHILVNKQGINNDNLQEGDNPASFAADWLTRCLTYNYIWALNSYILFLPHWLCFDWSMGCIPLIETLWDGRNVLSSVMWVFLAFLVWRGVNKDVKITAALVSICVPFLPATNLIFRVGFVVAERTLFLPSMGTCYLVAEGAAGVKWLKRTLPLLCLIFLIK